MSRRTTFGLVAVASLGWLGVGCGVASVRATLVDGPHAPVAAVVVMPGAQQPAGFRVLAVLEGDGAYSAFGEESILAAFVEKARELGCTHLVGADEHRNYEGTSKERLQRQGEALCGIVVSESPPDAPPAPP